MRYKYFKRIESKLAVLFTVIMLCVGLSELSAQDNKVYQGFSGGMMLHTGYLFGQNPSAPKDASGRSYSIQGAPLGIGGSLRVHLWKYLRTGFEGYVSTVHSWSSNQAQHLQPGSYARIGCGGFIADACWRNEKVWPYVGGAIGGGAVRSLYLVDGNQDDWMRENEAYVNKQSFFYVTPYVGMDYCLTQKVHLTFRLDWMIALHKNALVMPSGPRLYFGFMFTH